MSFQINKRERMKVCVSSSEEELRNTTVEELKRKLIPEDQPDDAELHYKHTSLQDDHTLGSYKIEHEDKISRLCRKRKPCSKRHKGRQTEVSVANSKEEFKNTRVEKIEIKIDVFICRSEPCPLFYKGKRLDRNRTLGSYGIKHKDVICKEYRNSDQDLYGIAILRRCKHRYPPPVDERVGAKRKDEVEIIPRSCSMEKLLCDMQQPQ